MEQGKLIRRNELKNQFRQGTISKEIYLEELFKLETKEKKLADNMGNKKAWIYQNDLIMRQSTEEKRPTIDDIKDKAMSIKHEKYQSLFIFLYLTAARISEVVKIVKKGNIERTIRLGRPVLSIKLVNRKNRKKKFKEVVISLTTKQEKDLVNIMMVYIDKQDDDAILFDFTRTAAHIYFRKNIGWNCHYLRHLRLTHLILNYGMNEQLLIKWAGWTDNRPAKNYINLITDDFIRVFPENE